MHVTFVDTHGNVVPAHCAVVGCAEPATTALSGPDMGPITLFYCQYHSPISVNYPPSAASEAALRMVLLAFLRWYEEEEPVEAAILVDRFLAARAAAGGA